MKILRFGIPNFELARYGIFKIWPSKCRINPKSIFEDYASKNIEFTKKLQ